MGTSVELTSHEGAYAVRTMQQILLCGVVAGLMGGVTPLFAQMQPPPVPAVHRHIYPEISQGDADVKAALETARAEHKRVLMIFGGDWCGDCQVLDINLHENANEELLKKYFVVVHVNIGHMDQNVELAQRYGVPLKRGVPAVAVVDAQGKVVHAQATGEFADMRHMDPRSVNQFLEQWKG